MPIKKTFDFYYPEINPGKTGSAGCNDGYTSNYYMDDPDRNPICCNCDKSSAQLE